MRLLHLYWPHRPLRLARARHSDSFPTDRPVVLGGQPWTDGMVLDADPAARALGVRRGIPLGSAHRLAPEAAFLDPEPEADAKAVETAF
jgi:nucleotidyltransferase/DNA polymerase involved in DNA repair